MEERRPKNLDAGRRRQKKNKSTKGVNPAEEAAN